MKRPASSADRPIHARATPPGASSLRGQDGAQPPALSRSDAPETPREHAWKTRAISLLDEPQFYCEEAALAWLEATLWPAGPICPHCGGMDRIGKIRANPERRVRRGLYKCGPCRKQFTVKVGTFFEHTRIPLHKLLQAVYLVGSSRKQISVNKLRRIIDVQYRSAWLLAHRVRVSPDFGDSWIEFDPEETGAAPGTPCPAEPRCHDHVPARHKIDQDER